MASITIQQLFNWKSRLNRFFNLFGSIPAIFQLEIKNHFLVIRAFVLFDSSELAFFPEINSGEKMLASTFIWNIFISLDGIEVFYILAISPLSPTHTHTPCLQKLLNDPHSHKYTIHESKLAMTCTAGPTDWTLNGFQGNISFSVFSWAGRELRSATRKVTSCAMCNPPNLPPSVLNKE